MVGSRSGRCDDSRRQRRGGLGWLLPWGLLVGAPLLLRRMRRELTGDGALSPATTVWMYTTYAAHALLYGRALRRRGEMSTVPSRPVTGLGAVMAVAGVAASARAMAEFRGAAQVSGTEIGPFVTGGPYRWSRNPQYVGYVLFLSGGALLRRSTVGLALAAGAAAAYRWWVPVEERHLCQVVGAPYEDYLAATPRWLAVRR